MRVSHKERINKGFEMNLSIFSIVLRKMFFPAILTAVMLGCTSYTKETIIHGHIISDDILELIPVGSSREQVILNLGAPSITPTFGDKVFYYISQKRERKAAFLKDKVIEQRILAIYFGKDERISKIANYGLKDKKLFDFIARVTPTEGKDIGFLSQLLKMGSK